MNDMLTWLAASGERVTVVGLLLIAIFVVVYGIQPKQRWWVPGWMLTRCEEESAKKDAKIQAYVDRTQERLDTLEKQEEERSRTRKRTS